MDAHGHVGGLVVLGQGSVDALHVVVAAGVGDAQDADHGDGVVVNVLHALLGRHVQMIGVHGNLAHLDVPVTAELLPADLVAARDDEVRAVRRVDVDARGLRKRLPAEQRGQAAQHAGLRRAHRGGAHGLLVLVGVPQILDDTHAAVLQVGRHRVLVLVDGVLLQRVLHQFGSFGFHVSLDESAQVLVRVALGADVLADDLAGDTGLDGIAVELGGGHFDV